MWLSVGYLARHRAFSRLFRQVRRQLQPTIAAFDALKIKNPMCNALLVDFTDEEGRDYFEVVENSDQFFQVLVGCSVVSAIQRHMARHPRPPPSGGGQSPVPCSPAGVPPAAPGVTLQPGPAGRRAVPRGGLPWPSPGPVVPAGDTPGSPRDDFSPRRREPETRSRSSPPTARRAPP